MSEITSAPGAQGATPPPLLEPPPVVTLTPVVSSVSAAPAETLVPWVSIWKLASTSGFGESHAASIVLSVSLLGGAVGGILFLFVLTSLVGVAGRWLGGQGHMPEVMAALAWSYVPAIWGLALWLPRAALLGEETFQSLPASIEGNPPAALLFGLLQLAQTLIGFWGFLITLKCIAEAQRFSAWRALGAFVVVGLMVGVPVGLVMLAAQALS